MRPAGTNVKITDYEISEVKEVYRELGSYAETGRALNISAGVVSHIVRGIGRFAEGGDISVGRFNAERSKE